MKTQIITPISFGIYKNTKITSYGERIRGNLNGYQIDIYTAKNEDKSIKHKLFYVSKAGKWIKSKLNYYKNNILEKVIRGQSGNDIL